MHSLLQLLNVTEVLTAKICTSEKSQQTSGFCVNGVDMHYMLVIVLLKIKS